MNETTKESKFLDAINKYAEKQKSIISSEVEEYKAQKIEQATDAGLKDAYDLIRRDIAERKSAIVTEYAQKEYALRRDLYDQRKRITDEVFAAAVEKILAYTATEEYRQALIKQAKEAAALCEGDACTLSLRPDDLPFADVIAAQFPSAAIREDSTITLGGFKAQCDKQGILIDCTLDAKLSEARVLFAERSGLKVV